MNKKGQASVTDALYFLLIVTFLSVFLFGFANSYGSVIREQLNDEYNTTFATNALKTILYSSTPRNPDKTIFDDDAEIDYLLALVKEDYSDDLQVNETEMNVLGKSISAILAPVEDTLDYMFYIHIPGDEQKIVYLLVHVTNFQRDDADVPAREFYVYSADPTNPHLNYFCGLNDDFKSFEGPDYKTLMAKMTKLRANIGPTSEASSAIKLVKERNDSTFDSFKAEANLILWDAVWLGQTSERTQGLFYNVEAPPFDTIDIDPAWGCQDVSFS